MDLNLFPPDTVELFMDLIYGEETSKVSSIDVGNLLRLADYLQVPDIILTEILQTVISSKNYLILHELALSYNCNRLRRVFEWYISNNLKNIN